MFSDLVGSTALSARMDPEDLREVSGVHHWGRINFPNDYNAAVWSA
jgi:hypothetical protein